MYNLSFVFLTMVLKDYGHIYYIKTIFNQASTELGHAFTEYTNVLSELNMQNVYFHLPENSEKGQLKATQPR